MRACFCLGLGFPAWALAGDIDGDGTDDASDRCPTIAFESPAWPSSCVHPSATLGVGVVIDVGAEVGAGATLGDDASLSTDVVVGAGATIGAATGLGARTRVGAGASIGVACFVGSDVIFGDGAAVGDDCAVTFGTVVGRGASVGVRSQLGPSAEIGGGAALGDDVTVGQGATVGSRAEVGEFSIIGGEGTIFGQAPAVVGRRARVGVSSVVAKGAMVAADTDIGPFSVIRGAVGYGAITGSDVTVGQHARIANLVTLGSDVVIEDNAVIGRSTQIGDRARVEDHARVGAGALVLDDVVVEADSQVDKAARLEENAVIGGHARVGAGATVCQRAVVGFGAQVRSGALVGYGRVVDAFDVVGRDGQVGPDATCVLPSPTDTDGDGHLDAADNCPFNYNPDQVDLDADGVCDPGDPSPGPAPSERGYADVGNHSGHFDPGSLFWDLEPLDPEATYTVLVDPLPDLGVAGGTAHAAWSVYTGGAPGLADVNFEATLANSLGAYVPDGADDRQIDVAFRVAGDPFWHVVPNCSTGSTTASGTCTMVSSDEGVRRIQAPLIHATQVVLRTDGDVDRDGDHPIDNCPYRYNPDQTDLDGDGVCDPDDPTPGPAPSTLGIADVGDRQGRFAAGRLFSSIQPLDPTATYTVLEDPLPSSFPNGGTVHAAWSLYTGGAPGIDEILLSASAVRSPGRFVPDSVASGSIDVVVYSSGLWIAIPNCASGQTTTDGRCTSVATTNGHREVSAYLVGAEKVVIRSTSSQ